jgi:transcriptional regulator with XRE-family HTH domain
VSGNQTRPIVLQDLFPLRLRQLRKEKKLTQLQLSIAVGVVVNSVKRWEKGKRFPDPTEIQAIAQALGVPIRELFFFPEHPSI